MSVGPLRRLALTGALGLGIIASLGTTAAQAAQAAQAGSVAPSVARTVTVDGGTLTFGGTPSTINIPVAGDKAKLAFAGTAGSRVLFESSSASMSIVWTVYRPNGTKLYSSPVSTVNAVGQILTLPTSGTYTITFGPLGNGTGTLTFKGWVVPADASGTLAIGGGSVVSTTTVPGQNASLTFTATAGQRIQLQASSANNSAAWSLVAPSGAVLFSRKYYETAALMDTTTLTQSGTYTISIDPHGVSTGSVTFAAWSVPADVQGGALAVDGAALRVTTTSPGQNASVTLSGTAGQRVMVRSSAVTMPSTWSVLAPSGAVVAKVDNTALAPANTDAVTLPATGTYTISIDPTTTHVGAITLTAVTVPADVAVGALTVGGAAKTFTNTAAGQNGTLTFTGTAGQKVTVTASAAKIMASWTVVSPSGTVLYSRPLNKTSGASSLLTLPTTGTYTITVDPYGMAVGSVTFAVA